MRTICNTKRLIIRHFVEDDHAFIIALLNTEGWLQNIGNRHITTTEAATGYITDVLRAAYTKQGYGLYLVALQNGTPAGMCGFVKRDALTYPDLGFAFLPEYTGNGFAYESADALLHHGFSKLGFEKLAAITMPTNQRSINLLKKLQFLPEGDIVINNESLLLFGRNR